MHHTILVSATLGFFACVALLVSAILRRRSIRKEVAEQIKEYTTPKGQADEEEVKTLPVDLPDVVEHREELNESIRETVDAMADTPAVDELRDAALRAERAIEAARRLDE